jgi:hypothetical protein
MAAGWVKRLRHIQESQRPLREGLHILKCPVREKREERREKREERREKREIPVSMRHSPSSFGGTLVPNYKTGRTIVISNCIVKGCCKNLTKVFGQISASKLAWMLGQSQSIVELFFGLTSISQKLIESRTENM